MTRQAIPTRSPMACKDTEKKCSETICGLIAEQAKAQPERIAIVDGVTRIAFASLLKQADIVASELLKRDFPKSALVGVCMKRNWELISCLLGIMRAGCAYLPLDPAYPEERIRYMLHHSGAAAAIVDEARSAGLCSSAPEVLWLNELEEYAPDRITDAAPGDLAYVIYTSGSTGKPKGVAVEQRNLAAMSRAMGELLGRSELEGVLAAASICFDTSVMETLGTLSLGGTVILAESALDLPNLPHADSVKTCVMVPSSMQALLATETLPKSIECVVFGGEALKRPLVNQIEALVPRPRVVNAYGPTEDTVFSTVSEVAPGEGSVTIGKAVAGSRAYILDDQMAPVAAGTPGELYLAGSKLARGYLFDEIRTNERFIALDSPAPVPESRLFRTGDLCSWSANGEIEFHGRVDNQVKIRGFRIELGEVESVLESIPGVEAAAAAATEGGIGQKMLAAYIVNPDQTLTDAAVKSYLAQRLPHFMIPKIIIRLDQLPRLPNGKLDRNKLPGPGERCRPGSGKKDIAFDNNSSGNRRSPETVKAEESVILSLVQNEVASILNIGDCQDISPTGTFESFGLDSLTSLELTGRLSKQLGRRLDAQAINKNPTPSALVNHIIGQRKNEESESIPGGVPDTTSESLAGFQTHIRSSHPTFQAAKANAWSTTDKAILVQEVMRMVNDLRRNPYSKVLRTGSATRGTVTDAYNDEVQEAIIWTTNLYLGLNRDKQVIEEARHALESFGTGMGTSAAASGMTDLHLQFEAEFARLVGKPGACLFPTGYTANVGVIAGLLGRNDVVVIDQLCHASIVDGARLSGASVRTFKHNSSADLEAVLESEVSPYRTILVVLEGVYSMGEGAAPVAEIVRTAKRYDALTLVDEAHSFGFYGPCGAGISADQGVTAQVDFVMTTLSKALGSLGGVIAASREHVDLLKSSSRAYIFQASVSPADMAAALTALRRLREDDALRERLWDTTRYMRKQFEDAGYDLGTGDGPIVTPHFSDKDKLYAIVQGLYKRGVQTSAVTYPIVEAGRGRLRLICSAAHTREDVDKTLAALIEAEREADKQLATAKSESAMSCDVESAIDEWASAFSSYVSAHAPISPGSSPHLAITVQATGRHHPMKIVVRGGDIVVKAREIHGLPKCSLHLRNDESVTALCSSDPQGLLQSISSGDCELSGQIEPFIWFFARIVEYRGEASALRKKPGPPEKARAPTL